jgi:flagellar biosynthesis protein FlhF
LAKIAAGFVLNKQAKAALITADTYRISAVEQLKTYSDIIGLPLDIVYNQDELRKAIRKHEDKDLILIDTAGRSQYNEYQLEELKTLLKANSRIEKHLVLSATTKERDARDIIERFSFCNPKRIIFTKVDETSSLGIILNLLYEKDMALSYLADGQSVPDDITVAGAETLAGLFLRE